MGQALYRTHRSRKLSEVVGQEHITDTLTAALKKGLISHAYLFTGPHGVGKTSVARILAHEINQLPYSDDSIHLDIIEIDAASNRRIDEIRDLREKVHLAPTSAKYKVYIIDEVHMLTREAFNALLKTLEEPPAHVVFILATTEAHKLPETIISRTQRFTFRPISVEKVVGHLREIASKEKFAITDDALKLIAEHGGGTFRDSISVLDQMRSLGREITAADVASTLGVASVELIQSLFTAIQNHDPYTLTSILTQLQNQGAEPAQVAKQFGELLRERFIANEHKLTHTQTIHLLTTLLDVPNATDPRVFLQITLLDTALSNRPSSVKEAEVPQPSTQATPSAPKATHTSKRPAAMKTTSVASTVTEALPQNNAVVVSTNAVKPTEKPTTAATKDTTKDTVEKSVQTTDTETSKDPPQPSQNDEALSADIWPQVLAAIKKSHSTLYSILRMAAPSFEPGKITLEIGFPFHQKRLNETHNKQIIAETIESITSQQVAIACILGEQKPAQPPLPSAGENEVAHNVQIAGAAGQDSEKGKSEFDYYVNQAEEASARPLDTVNNIFGGGELLGS
ncbi:MAG TPA: DNA polymerase III subunit gamma/tau [Candidatus Saccharimonadales bacterium]|nr:DNA polymerase III subunit gamma/tau [Candidatus Saccharimonadales bacterium]